MTTLTPDLMIARAMLAVKNMKEILGHAAVGVELKSHLIDTLREVKAASEDILASVDEQKQPRIVVKRKSNFICVEDRTLAIAHLDRCRYELDRLRLSLYQAKTNGENVLDSYRESEKVFSQITKETSDLIYKLNGAPRKI